MKHESILNTINLKHYVPFKLNGNFVFGVATASTQIEGKDYNSNWSLFCLKNKIKDGSNTLICNESYDNYIRDINLIKQLHIQSYRFSLDWPKINPRLGVFDLDAINHYINQIKLLKKLNISPMVTLHHFSNPIWFENKKGFLKKRNIKYFLNYVRFVITKLKDLVNDYCIINEPNVYAVNSFFFGIWLNEEKSLFKTIKIMKNMSIAYKKSYEIIKFYNKNSNVGFAMHIQDFIINKNNFYNRLCLKVFNSCFNDACLKAMAGYRYVFPFGILSLTKKKYYDYVGINFYTQNVVNGFSYHADDKYQKNDLGWAITPMSLKKVVEKYHNLLKKDIYITENGVADANDSFRKQFIYSHLYAIKDLNYVKRYYYWTLMDNFEWAEGFNAKFGLINYDIKTKNISIRDSGYMYKEIIDNNGFNELMIKKYL